MTKWRKTIWLAMLASTMTNLLLGSQKVDATVVRFHSGLGNIDVRLFDHPDATPLSVANFLYYVNSGRYNNSIIHRSVPGKVDMETHLAVNPSYFPGSGLPQYIPGFVVQGGGYNLNGNTISSLVDASRPPVLNEPVFSNTRKTLAYAKLGGDPNSATSQWFFNLNDNSDNLDSQNGGFTVFGSVINDSMTVVDSIAALTSYNLSQNLGSSFSQTPLMNASTLVKFTSIEVLDIPDGDFDLDGDVDGSDFLKWQVNLGSTENVEADADGNGSVGASDLAIWKSGFGSASGSGSSALQGTSVPEPSSLIALLILSGASAIYAFKRSKRRE